MKGAARLRERVAGRPYSRESILEICYSLLQGLKFLLLLGSRTTGTRYSELGKIVS